MVSFVGSGHTHVEGPVRNQVITVDSKPKPTLVEVHGVDVTPATVVAFRNDPGSTRRPRVERMNPRSKRDLGSRDIQGGGVGNHHVVVDTVELQSGVATRIPLRGVDQRAGIAVSGGVCYLRATAFVKIPLGDEPNGEILGRKMRSSHET